MELNDDVFGGRRTEAVLPWPSEDLGLYIGRDRERVKYSRLMCVAM